MSCYLLGAVKGERRGLAENFSAFISFSHFSAPKENELMC